MKLNSDIYRIGAWIGVVLLGGAAVMTALRGRWQGAALLAVFLIGSIVFLKWRSRLPDIFSLLFVLAAILNAAGWVFDLWDRIAFYDPFTHAYTSFSITLALGFALYYSVLVQFEEHSWLFVLSVAALGVSLGSLWEIVEWLLDVEQTYTTLVTDLIMNSLGAVSAGLLMAWLLHHKSASQLQS